MTMMSDGLADAAGAAAAVGAGGGATVSALDIAELLAGSLVPTIPGGRQLPVIQ
jgi:hypothetical protein